MPPLSLGITGDKYRTHKPFNLLNFIQLQYTEVHYCSGISFAKITTKRKMVKIFSKYPFNTIIKKHSAKSSYLRTERMAFKTDLPPAISFYWT